jgi:predicted ATPase/class 3 adenylate cyclase
MRCSKCGSDNRTGRKFCADCGAPIIAACPRCSACNQPNEKFCGECGAALADALTVAIADAAPVAALSGGERRHLTVLFCDLVGSTEIAARLDPEEWRETVAGYHRAAADAITRYGGHVAKFLGDGVMAFFGYPEAHDDDAERATRAGLAIVEAIAKLEKQAIPAKLAVRIGIDSGLVVVGAGAGKETDVFGEAPNVAARVQAVAEPDNVLITSATHRLVSGLFVVEERGAQKLKGITQPFDLFRVIRPSGMRGRLAAAAAVRGMTPFVNREEELNVLMNRWERVREGEGQVVTIIGEAGIGKSRLVQHFRNRIAGDPHTWLECTTVAFSQNTPFYAITDMLQQTFHWHTNQDPQRRLVALEASLALAGLKLGEAVPLVASLLALPVDGKNPLLAMAPEQQRKRLLATLAEWTIGFAKAQPLVMATEDLHWADPSTLELIQILIQQGATAPLMLLNTARPEFDAQWPLRAHQTHITLNRLSARNVRTMVGQVAAQKALSEETVRAVVERTSGVPLFVEELTRAVLESGDKKLTGREIPATLHDSLMARLDRLGIGKEVIQIGAVIGSEFSYGLLHAVHPIRDEDLQRAIQSATDAELVYVRGIAPDATYQFKHALIRDAAYEAMLRNRRKELHSRIAEALVGQFPDTVTSAPELLAHHYTEAGLIEQAIPYWQQAGQRASERSANVEAISHLAKALELLKSLQDTPKRTQQELALQTTLGPVFIAHKGWAAPETGKVYTRARELCQQVGEPSQLFPVLWGLYGFHVVRAEHQTARELGEQLLGLAESQQNPAFRVQAYFALALSSLALGELSAARKYGDQGSAVYDPLQHSSHAFLYGHNPGMSCLAFGALTLWHLGYPDQALNRTQEALTLARQASHPFSLAYALNFSTWLHQFRGEQQTTREQAEAVLALSTEQEFPFWMAYGTILRGWVLAEQGQREEGIAQIRQGLAAFRATGSGIWLSYCLVLLAAVYGKVGQAEEGLGVLAEAFAFVGESEEHLYEAELYRLKGTLVLQSGVRKPRTQDLAPSFQVEAEAKACFLKAIEIARRQQAKSLELRAVTSLARFWQQQGKNEQALDMLSETYGWFTEGFDTADLKDAKALLDQLAT